jgi:hypothetical protein
VIFFLSFLIVLSGCETMQAIDKAIADSINKENADKTAGQDKQTSESNSQSVRSDSNSQSRNQYARLSM